MALLAIFSASKDNKLVGAIFIGLTKVFDYSSGSDSFWSKIEMHKCRQQYERKKFVSQHFLTNSEYANYATL